MKIFENKEELLCDIFIRVMVVVCIIWLIYSMQNKIVSYIITSTISLFTNIMLMYLRDKVREYCIKKAFCEIIGEDRARLGITGIKINMPENNK